MVATGVVNGRFQVFHLKHMEYLLAAKMRCNKLYIGLTNPDNTYVRETVNDENRSAKSANPLTYYERCQMIRGALREFNVPDVEYEFIPFPINRPEYILQYAPQDAVYYMGICDDWDEEKYKILRSLGLEIEILWRREPEEKGITASWIRSCIATDEEWAHLVPKSVYEYLTGNDLDLRIRRLELIRMAEKDMSLVKDRI
ncbi:nicotinate-nucleotide adenylyltransferase [Dorea sp. D27]|uniref:nicotinate-nucleotide adenylyltransferase n=1 Tax=Dorea sp. D27 TaxID=658665 RepID=UPI000673A68F|nr:nicotinate-nucleotide adenylyltransferase [Dorea sp. D27]KMZ55777.1 nicotinamide-nucleotide adenylyltransferase [Dorea sp. D27]